MSEVIVPVHENVFIEKLRFYTRHVPIPKMLKKTEGKIMNQIPKRLRDKYPGIVGDYMDDVREDYDKIIKAFSLQKVLRPLPGDYIPPRFDFAFKRLGRTEHYEQFCINRDKIQRILMLPYPFIRCIIDYSWRDFPKIFNDFSKYREVLQLNYPIIYLSYTFLTQT